MSAEENTRLAQSAYEAFGRGDMEALAEMMADDIEWVNPGDPADDPNAGTFKGKEAVLGWFGGLASTLDFTTFEPREFIAQNDKLVSLVYAEATVRDTGRAVVNHEAHVWTFRDGKVARLQIYLDTAAVASAYRADYPARATGGSYVACASVLSPGEPVFGPERKGSPYATFRGGRPWRAAASAPSGARAAAPRARCSDWVGASSVFCTRAGRPRSPGPSSFTQRAGAQHPRAFVSRRRRRRSAARPARPRPRPPAARPRAA